MSSNVITRISPSVRMLILIILILSLLLAKSIYLLLFIITLTLILCIITGKKVNLYVKALKKMSILLLIFIIIYIIIFRQYDIISICILLVKLIIVVVLFKILFLNMNFCDLHMGIYGILKPLKRYGFNIEKISLDITLSIYFINFLMESNCEIKKVQKINGIKKINVKNLILPSIIYSINQLDKLQSNLKVKFYKLNYKKANISSKIILILFILLFVICVYKEVVL